MPLLQDGQKIADAYEVERFLGEGAFAEVYRVNHRFLGRQGMKVFKASGMSLPEIHDMLGEAVLLSKIGHPNIIRVFNADILECSEGRCGFFTMEYVPGGSLHDFWRSYRSRLMPVAEAVSITKQVCLGLSVAHNEQPPIVHRDIKPQNVLIGYDGTGMRVKVADFGLAKQVSPLTLLASARGTIGFKPPESLDNLDSCAADVWSVGTTLYLLLTDTLPFPSLDERDLSDAKRFLRPLRPASTYNIHVDTALDGIVQRCLATNPPDRYSDASELLEDLSHWQPARETEHPISAEGGGTKETLGTSATQDEEAPRRKVRKALRWAEEPGKLMIAADLLEEAINKDPRLREEYESRLKLWRRGVSM